MINETYLTHPTFGLLFSICQIDNERSLYTTLYAQRLFFIVTMNDDRLSFNSISRQEAKSTVENRMRALRRAGSAQDIKILQTTYQQTFQ